MKKTERKSVNVFDSIMLNQIRWKASSLFLLSHLYFLFIGFIIANTQEENKTGLELAKSQQETQTSKGYAKGHLTACEILMATKVATSRSQWLAGTGTVALLEFLNGRNMKVYVIAQTVAQE